MHGERDPGSQASPAALAGKGEVGSAFLWNAEPSLSQLPIASPLPMVLLLAALSAIKKTGPVVAS